MSFSKLSKFEVIISPALISSPAEKTSSLAATIDSSRVVPDLGEPTIKILFFPCLEKFGI